MHEDWLDGKIGLKERYLGIISVAVIVDSKFLTDVTPWGGVQYEDDWPKY